MSRSQDPLYIISRSIAQESSSTNLVSGRFLYFSCYSVQDRGYTSEAHADHGEHGVTWSVSRFLRLIGTWFLNLQIVLRRLSDSCWYVKRSVHDKYNL